MVSDPHTIKLADFGLSRWIDEEQSYYKGLEKLMFFSNFTFKEAMWTKNKYNLQSKIVSYSWIHFNIQLKRLLFVLDFFEQSILFCFSLLEKNKMRFNNFSISHQNFDLLWINSCKIKIMNPCFLKSVTSPQLCNHTIFNILQKKNSWAVKVSVNIRFL